MKIYEEEIKKSGVVNIPLESYIAMYRDLIETREELQNVINGILESANLFRNKEGEEWLSLSAYDIRRWVEEHYPEELKSKYEELKAKGEVINYHG